MTDKTPVLLGRLTPAMSRADAATMLAAVLRKRPTPPINRTPE